MSFDSGVNVISVIGSDANNTGTAFQNSASTIAILIMAVKASAICPLSRNGDNNNSSAIIGNVIFPITNNCYNTTDIINNGNSVLLPHY